MLMSFWTCMTITDEVEREWRRGEGERISGWLIEKRREEEEGVEGRTVMSARYRTSGLSCDMSSITRGLAPRSLTNLAGGREMQGAEER
jgi:hypothetical protein